MDHAIGTICYRGHGVSYSVVLPVGETQPFVVEQRKNEDEQLKANLLETYPGIILLNNAYVFGMACDEFGASHTWSLPEDDLLPPRHPQKFQVWEWVMCAGIPHIITDVTAHRLTYQYGMRSEIGNFYRSSFEDKLERMDPQPPVPSEVTLDIPGKVGDIVSWHGHQYRVTETNYISGREAADLEDGFDVFDAQGWYTRGVLVGRTACE